MAFSLKKRSRSKSQTILVNGERNKSLGEILHRSTKTKKNDKNLIPPKETLSPPSDDIQIKTPLSTHEKPILYRTRCPCETHHEKELLEQNYEINVDKLFDLIFGSNEFVRTYRQAQRFYDDTATEWTKNPITNYRERILNYKVPYESTFIGKGTISTRETQILFHEVPGSHYMVETKVSNEGVKFSDTFSLTIRFCLVQTSLTITNLCVTAQIAYSKAVIGFIKRLYFDIRVLLPKKKPIDVFLELIERNAYSASLEGLKDLNNRLNLISNFKMGNEK
ncbi:hypothetical protein I4U23_024496 [Adineta vaga]|nr:hypothetical protein I4U23_024496 [Adineta vaga]